jgi:outer membrane lipoprotein-sorting protein
MRQWYSVCVGVVLAVPFFGFAQAEVPQPGKARASTSATSKLPPPPVLPQKQQNAQNMLPTPIAPPSRGSAVPRGRTLALDAQQRAMVEKINVYLGGVQTLMGDFVQVGPDGSRTDGKFYLQKPGRMRFEYNSPSPLELIADGRSVAIRDRKLATQDLLLLSQTPLRFLLSEKIDLLKEGNLVNVYSDDVFVTVVLEEKQTLGGTHRLMLMFSAQDMALKQWTVTDPQGYDTTVALYNTDSAKKPDPGLFKINYERLRD